MGAREVSTNGKTVANKRKRRRSCVCVFVLAGDAEVG